MQKETEFISCDKAITSIVVETNQFKKTYELGPLP